MHLGPLGIAVSKVLGFEVLQFWVGVGLCSCCDMQMSAREPKEGGQANNIPMALTPFTLVQPVDL